MDDLEASGDPEGESSGYLTGRKKARLKSFKSLVFGKMRKEDDGGMKLSRSESDITRSVEDSEEVFTLSTWFDCCKGMLWSRAFSHDSIFQAECSHSDPEPLRTLSQEHIPALQMKLQQQKQHLGAPSLLLLFKRREVLGGSSGDGGLSCNPSEASHTEGLYTSISNKFSVPPKNHSTLSLAETGSEEEEQASVSVDFSTPPQFTSLLNNSAARHRMSLKPKNQRASAKNRRATITAGSRARSESLNNLDQSLNATVDETLVKEIPHARSYSSQVLQGERLMTSQINSPLPVSPLMRLHTSGDSRKVSAEPQLERNLLSKSPPSHSLRDTTPAVSPFAKLPIPVVPIDRKGKADVSEMLSSSKLLKNHQSTIVSTVSPSVTTTPELSTVKDEKSVAVPIETKMEKCSVQNAVNIENHPASAHASTNVISAINLRPSSLRRNIPSTDEKQKKQSGTLQPGSTALAVCLGNHTPTESIKHQRTGSFHFSVSSDKNQERPRTASFTGVVGQAGFKNKPPCPVKPPLHFKIERLASSQVVKTVKDTCPNIPPASKKEDQMDTSPAMPTKFTDLAKSRPRALDVEESQDHEKKETGVEVTEEGVLEVEVTEEAREGVMKDTTMGKEREATNAFGVKLRSTSLSLKFGLDKAQSEDKVKIHNVEVSAAISPSASQSDSSIVVEPEDQCIGMRSTGVHTKLKDSPLQTDASSTLVHSFSSPPKSFCRDKERAGVLGQAAKEDADVPPEETTAGSSQENAPTSTASEVSWMEMAREKTRSLQQLFTSKLPEFPSWQSPSTTLTTTQPQTQTSTSQTKNPTIAQNISSQPTTTPSANSTQTTTSESQNDSSREVQILSKTQICNSTTKPSHSTVTCTPLIQPSSPLRAASQTPSQAILRPTPPPGHPHLSSSPKITSHLVSRQSANTVSKDQPQNEGRAPAVFSGKADRLSASQGKGTGSEDGRPVWAAGSGNKTSLLQRWENQTTVTTETGELNSTADSRTTSQSTVPLRPMSKVSGTGFDSGLSMQASVSSVPTRSADRENKSPSSSPSSSPLQSVRNNAQPSWMELAKRKSLAWSDKTMD
ncbi:flocculation protein FLO11-like isoform X2 [Carassius auratus]|uniref:Flocculation protein FLO11-like isoform X2 n=1 Tax=Carassius auratus TaxID=7957 RepID=A0A6P6KQN8_CARAU|nr:flocculation protein FLO11-like isoform X2 [Carassius auratus]